MAQLLLRWADEERKTRINEETEMKKLIAIATPGSALSFSSFKKNIGVQL